MFYIIFMLDVCFNLFFAMFSLLRTPLNTVYSINPPVYPPVIEPTNSNLMLNSGFGTY